ncbi:MAG: RHS repeat-associated core domain-containing protein, partial [Bacteroidota bacterium]
SWFCMGCLKLTYDENPSPLYVSANNFGGDENSGLEWNSFELRMYDPLIGRWLIPDPYRVGFSPYIGMANDPVNKADPDGGCPEGENCPGFEEGVSNSDVMLEGFTFTSPAGDKASYEFRMQARSGSWMYGIHTNHFETQWQRDFETFAGAGANAISATIAAPFVASTLWEGTGNLGSLANQGAARAYLWATGNSGAFATVSGFSVGVGRITYRYHGSFNAAIRGRWSTVNRLSTGGEAFNKLALDYGKANLARYNLGQYMFKVRNFGVYINGTAAPQNMTSGGGQQMLRIIGKDVIQN